MSVTSRHLISLAVAGYNRAFMVTGAPSQDDALAYVLGYVAPSVALDLTRGPVRPSHLVGPAYGLAEPLAWVADPAPPKSGRRSKTPHPMACRALDVATGIDVLLRYLQDKERARCGVALTKIPPSVAKILRGGSKVTPRKPAQFVVSNLTLLNKRSRC